MSAVSETGIQRRVAGSNIWLERREHASELMTFKPQRLNYEVLPSEDAVGQAMFEEIQSAAARTTNDLTIILLGGRGAQALHRLLGELARTSEVDTLLGRLNVFTQD